MWILVVLIDFNWFRSIKASIGGILDIIKLVSNVFLFALILAI